MVDSPLNQYQGGMCIRDLEDDRKDSTARHITLDCQPGRHRQCDPEICTFYLGFSLGLSDFAYVQPIHKEFWLKSGPEAWNFSIENNDCCGWIASSYPSLAGLPRILCNILACGE